MHKVQGLKRFGVPLVCGSVLLALGHLATAAELGSINRPQLRVGPAQAQVTTPDIASGPQYGLFKCQVIGAGSAANCLDPYEMRRAYRTDTQIAAGYDGSGQTIVIVDAYDNPNLEAQIAHFNAYYGLPPTHLTRVAPDGLVPFDPTDPNMVGWAEEISLDVEWAHAIAPGANIVLVQARTPSDVDISSALKYAVDNRLGDVVSMSFGENESCIDPAQMAAYHQIFVNATKKNMTLVASSADQGAAQSSCDGTSWVKAVSSPAVDPLVTGVGGTELTVAKYCLPSLGCDPTQNPAAGTYQSETVWNEGLPYGDYGNLFGYGTLSGGGGYSVVYGEPPYQQGTIHGGKQRAVPDVSYSGAVEHGVLTYLDIPGVPAGFYLFGGTSAGAPQWAAIAAITNHKAGHALGFLNSALYKIGRTPVGGSGLHDITVGTNSSLQFDQYGNPVDIVGYGAGPGWDAASGIGTPIASSIVDLLIAQVAPGDAVAVINNTKATPVGKPAVTGRVKPH
ncbi:MAG: S53 family peptidase [Burkholderiales bacterium]|nr:S53 family peptidase [Burkholderiales bacterium]